MIWTFQGERIRLARESKDLTQKQLADLIGVSPQQVSAWELGNIKPGQDSLLKMVNTLGVAPRFFFVETANFGNDLMPESIEAA